MDPLSISSAVIAILQATSTLLSVCYTIRAALRKLPWPLTQMIEEIRDLRNITEAIQTAADGFESRSNGEGSNGERDVLGVLGAAINGPLQTCISELTTLEGKLRPMLKDVATDSKRKAVIQAVRWQLNEGEAKDCLMRLERCKSSLTLAIGSQNSISLRNIEKMTLVLNHKIDRTFLQLEALTELTVKSKLSEQERDLISWISNSSPWERHHTAIKLHQPGTGEWLTDTHEYQDWLDGRSKILWLSGPPGAGKTILFARSIENLSKSLEKVDKSGIIAFTYCDFQNAATSQNITSVLGSMLRQICTQTGSFPEDLLSTYDARFNIHSVPSPPSTLVVNSLIEISRSHRLFLLVDAVDENDEVEQLMDTLVALADNSTTINLLITSRNNSQIQKRLADITLHINLEDQVKKMNDDIDLYIAGRLANSSGLTWLDLETRSYISSSLGSNACGMFQWVQCQLDSMARARNIRDIKRTIRSLPDGLNETYKRILSRIAPEDVGVFQKILNWVAFAISPLTLEELWEAVAIEPGSSFIDDEYRLRSEEDILVLGNSLFSMSTDGCVRLAHLSVRDYLLSDEIHQDAVFSKFALNRSEGHKLLAMDCLTYLSFTDLEDGPLDSRDEYLERLRRLPLLKYAATAWTYHLRATEPHEDLQELATSFFLELEKERFMAWVQIINADSNFKWDVYPKFTTPLYYASSFGLTNIVRLILSSVPTPDLDAPGSRFGGTALHAAVIRHHVDIIKLLLEKGAKAGQADFNGVTPLHTAARRGYREVAQLLLQYGAPMDVVVPIQDETPAQWAEMSGHHDLAQILGGKVKPVVPSQSAYAAARNASSQNSNEPVVWQRSPDYFPSIYENRSGLTSSLVVAMEVDGAVQFMDPDLAAQKN